MTPDAKQKPTYSISLWDHDTECDGSFEGAWSESLAVTMLEGPSIELSRSELAAAWRTLRELSWGDDSILIERDG